MSYSAVFVLVVIAILILVIAYFLLMVIYLLRKIDSTLGKIIFGVRSIAYRTEPINPIVRAINEDLSVVAGALSGLVEKTSLLEGTHTAEKVIGNGD